MKKFISVLFFLVGTLMFTNAQELNCNVQVNSQQIDGINKQVFTTLQKSLTEFMNNRHWTDMYYAPNEKIDCNITINISEHPTSDTYNAGLQIQARRPVYGTSYNSTILNFTDQTFNFTYKEFDQIEFNESTFDSNLSAVMAFYAYIIIGIDADSFSAFGGDPAFQKAENIVNMAQSTTEAGWKAFEAKKNRYDLISNMTDERVKGYREFFYEYHRLGLDEMTKSPINARAKIAQSILILQELNRNIPYCLVLQLFFDAKDDELINVFSQGQDKEKMDMYNLFVDLNPTKATKYDEIKKQPTP
jgi:hypothetical protein